MKQLAVMAAFVVASQASIVLAEESEDNFVYMPAPQQELLIIEQPMGRLVINGWDKDQVRIHSHKHAPNDASLERLRVKVEMVNGRVHIRTGVVVGNELRGLPPVAAGAGGAPAGIDLTIDAPRGAALQARTWNGDLEATGFRAGAELASKRGEVRARDIKGKVHTNADFGRQKLSSISGDVDAHGVTGDLELDTVDGDTLEANVVDGQITARDVHTPVVRLLSTAGGIVFIGTVRAGGRYQLTAMDGDVRLELERVPFTLHAQAGQKVTSGFRLVGKMTPREVDGSFSGGGPQLELTAAHGNVLLAPR
jgi:DUF4097 and DUF4098 domain-containing protein YvlB